MIYELPVNTLPNSLPVLGSYSGSSIGILSFFILANTFSLESAGSKLSIIDTLPVSLARLPSIASYICPGFTREGTDAGLSIASTWLPLASTGISESGRIKPIVPLLPCKPEILSPCFALSSVVTTTRVSLP